MTKRDKVYLNKDKVVDAAVKKYGYKHGALSQFCREMAAFGFKENMMFRYFDKQAEPPAAALLAMGTIFQDMNILSFIVFEPRGR